MMTRGVKKLSRSESLNKYQGTDDEVSAGWWYNLQQHMKIRYTTATKKSLKVVQQ